MLDLAFTPDRHSGEPVYQQLESYLRGLIQAERLAPGTKIPASREVAAAMGVSRNTVSQAYEELIAEGLLTAHVGQGTFVAPAPPVDATRLASADRARSRGFVWSGLLALRARTLTLPAGFRPPRTSRPIRFDFRGGQIATDALPARELARAFATVLERPLDDVARQKDVYGWPPLRREIARYLVERGIACEPGDVVVVNGAQHAIDLTARVLLDPGDTVVVEQPGYFGATLAFTAAQANVVGVGVDDEGMRTDELARVLRARRVKLVYTTPAAHSPTGAVMSDARRRMLLALADEHQTPIFEDDYDSELRYEGAPVPALKTMDAAGQVIYAGTFSKVLFPGLRVGYVVAARPLLEKMVLARWNGDVETSVLPQAALALLLARGGLERHVRRMRKLYAARLAAMLDALAEHMPPDAEWTTPRGGHSVWLQLPPGADPESIMHAALDAGIAYTPGNVFFADGRGDDAMALTFAATTPAAIRDGIAALGAIVQRHVRPRRKSSSQRGGQR